MGTIQETHKAIVTNNDDPEKRGRLKVRCQGLTGADFELPDWAEPSVQAYSTKNNGASLWLPEIGSTVELVVDVHDTGLDDMPNERFLQNPAAKWRPATMTTQDGPMPLPAALLTNYPARRGFVTPAGHQIILDDTSAEIIVKAKSGHKITMKSDGSIVLDSPTIIGDGATELMVLGNALMALYNAHIHNTGVGPTSTPVVAMSATQLSQEGNKVK